MVLVTIQQARCPMNVLALQEFLTSTYKDVLITSTMVLLTILMLVISTMAAQYSTGMDVQISTRMVGRTMMEPG